MLNTEITACGTCGGGKLTTILDLGRQPLAERESEPYPLVLLRCEDCTLVQLSYQVDPHEVFPPDHPYATGNTAFLRQHFAGLAEELAPYAPDDYDVVVDVGANDGTLLAAYPGEHPLTRVAVEPTRQAAKCRERGLRTFQEFFTKDVARLIVSNVGQAKVVTACNVLAHVSDPHDFLEGVRALLHPDGVFVTENHDVNRILRGLQIDTIYHEHLRYYSITSLSRLLGMHGLTVTRVDGISTHGGSFRVWASLQDANVSDLQGRAQRAAVKLNNLVETATCAGAVYGIGATTRATPLIHYANLATLITCVCEVAGSEKIGMMMPGTKIPVVPDEQLIKDQPPHALVFSWHIANGIITKLRLMGYGGKFIIPLPDPHVYDG